MYGQQNYGHERVFQVRDHQLRQMIHQLDRRNRLSNREARRLDRHAIDLLRRIDRAAYRGINPREQLEIERRIQGLHQAVRYESRDGNRWGWNGNNYHGNGYGYYGARHRDRDDDRRRDRDDDDHRSGHDDDDHRGERDDD